MKRNNPIVRPLLVALFSYLLTLGGTFNGITDPMIGGYSLILLAVVFAVLIGLHVVRGWRWHRSPLDAALVLWAGAILISLAANTEDWRRITIGIWYVSLYMLLWFTLHNLIANRVVQKSMLVDALLVGSVYMIAIGYFQLYNVAASGMQYSSFFGLPRPGSLIGNPNSYAALLIMVIALAAGRMIGLRSRFWSGVLTVYLVLALVQLFLTYSRGGWLGGAAALLTVAVGWLWTHNLLSPVRLMEWYHRQPNAVKAGTAGGVLVAVAGAGLVAVLMLRSFSQPGRTAELRTYLWDVAVQMFRQQPLTGHGLFTYGKAQEIMTSIPPLTPHSHAHNLPLAVLGELGLIGGAAMLFSIAMIMVYGWRSFRLLKGTERTTSIIGSSPSSGVLIAGLAMMIGYGVHLLVDTPVMMPAVAITGLTAILIVTGQPQSSETPQARPLLNHAFTGLYAVVVAALLVTGFSSNAIYNDYIGIVRTGAQSRDYATAADQLATVTEADPSLVVYHWQQGILYGLAAANAADADSTAESTARSALLAFERASALEPQNALIRANIAGLHRQLGETDAALDAYRQASDLAPRSWQIALAWAEFAESSGDTTQAQMVYARVISANPAAALHPMVAASPTAAPLIDGLALNGFNQMARSYIGGDYDAALAVWDATTATARTPQFYILRALIADAQDDTRAAEAFLSQGRARIVADDTVSPKWAEAGAALLQNDTDELAALSQPAIIQSGGTTPITLFRAQYIRNGLEVQALPQVGYELLDPILRRLLQDAMSGSDPQD